MRKEGFMARQVVIDTYVAAGGPRTATLGSDGFEAGPTDEGTFVISYYGQHSSTRYPTFSKIRWGSPLRETVPGKVEVLHEGAWRKLDSFPHAPSVDEIKNYNYSLYGRHEVPKSWVFNDFGHLTCYYFKDLNNNRKQDKSEPIHPEFIHTTPVNEAQTAKGAPVTLEPSHGCIHIAPASIDDMKKKGYMAKGTTLVVHSYDAKAPSLVLSKGKKPFEVHFYPGAHWIVVFGQSI